MTDQNELQIYASILWDPEDLIEVRCFPLKGVEDLFPKSFWMFAEDLPDIQRKLTKMNVKGYNIFAGVLPREKDGSSTDDECLPGRVVWCDFDHIKYLEAKRMAHGINLPPPSLVVDSGHGTHFYWRLTEKVNPWSLKQIVYDVAVALEKNNLDDEREEELFDKSVRNPSRVLRLPGYMNQKEPVAECRIVKHNENRVYTMDELRATVPLEALPDATTTFRLDLGGKIPRGRAEALKQASAYVETIATKEGNRNNAAYRVACLALVDFDLSENEAAHVLVAWNKSCCSPALSESELVTCLNSATKYASGEKGSKVREEEENQEGERRERRKKRKQEEDPEEDDDEDHDDQDDVIEDIRKELDGTKRLVRLPWDGLRESVPMLMPGKLVAISGLPGTSKSYLSLHLCQATANAQLQWAYLPMEDTRAYHIRRMVALVSAEWKIAQHFDRLSGRKRHKILERIQAEYGDLITEWGSGIHRNPTIKGKKVKAVHADDVLEWAEDRSDEGCRLIVIDPLAQIDFEGKEEWRAQASFVRSLIGIANCSYSTIVLVVHKAKTASKDGSVYSMEGSKRIGDLSFAALTVDFNFKEVRVMNKEDEEEEMTPNRIITIDKCRDGTATGAKIAFQFGEMGPSYREMGRIITGPKIKTFLKKEK